jgi:hypothetical protein
MVLYVIGLGLGDEKDITVKGLEAVQKCKRVYLEHYTAILSVGQERLVRTRSAGLGTAAAPSLHCASHPSPQSRSLVLQHPMLRCGVTNTLWALACACCGRLLEPSGAPRVGEPAHCKQARCPRHRGPAYLPAVRSWWCAGGVLQAAADPGGPRDGRAEGARDPTRCDPTRPRARTRACLHTRLHTRPHATSHARARPRACLPAHASKHACTPT